MQCYAAYGMVIASELALPELELSSGEPDLIIRLGRVQATHWEKTASGREVSITPQESCLRIPGYGTFAVHNLRELTLEPDAALDPTYWNSLILGPLLAFVLHLRGKLVLHGSAVMVDDAAVAFLGDSGSGKSTFAAAMHAQGAPFVADDHVVVDLTAAPVLRVLPGFPHLRLFPESAAAAGVDPQSLPRVDADEDKRGLRLKRDFVSHPLPPRVLYILADGETESIEPLAPTAALLALVRYSLLVHVLPATGTGAQHLEQCAIVARTLPIRQITRPRDLSALPALAARVRADAGGIK